MDNNLFWRSCGFTDIGTGGRKVNEDSFLTLPEQKLWMVADGMGGHARGDFASNKIKESFQNFKVGKSLSSTIEEIDTKVLQVNNDLRKDLEKNPNSIMGSTIALMFGYDSNAYFFWAGDSRIYLLRDGQFTHMTHDHSYVQEIVDRGELTEEEAEKHPSANIITRAVGAVEELHVDLDCIAVRNGDRYVICSDGLYKALSLTQIREKMDDVPMMAAENLVKSAVEHGAEDNVTVVAISITLK